MKEQIRILQASAKVFITLTTMKGSFMNDTPSIAWLGLDAHSKNCVLGHLEYVCPQTCPKQLRNGPCGGTDMGRCEVVDQPCVWNRVYERAAGAGRLEDLHVFVPAPDRSLTGTSSWLNYLLERDRRPGREGPPERQGKS